MKKYAVFKKDGTYITGNLPENMETERFCIMCAAAFGAASTAQKEYGDETRKLVIDGEQGTVIIKPFDKNALVAYIGTEEEMDRFLKTFKL